MKKLLLAGTALLAVSTVPARADEPIKLSIGGYLVSEVGYADNRGFNKNNDDPSNKKVTFGNIDDATISLKGQTRLKDGLNVSANVDFYATAGVEPRSITGACGSNPGLIGTQSADDCKGVSAVKRAYVTISGNFGALILGEREDATYIVHSSAPDVSPLAPIGDGYWFYWMASPTQHRSMPLDDDSAYDDRGLKTTYVTPAYHGLAGVFTYIPSMSLSHGANGFTLPSSSDAASYLGTGYILGNDFGGDAYGGGLAYSDSVAGVTLKADATILQANMANLRIWQQGFQAAYAGFTLGGSSLIRDVPSSATINGLTSNALIARALSSGISAAGVTANALAQTAVYAGNNYTLGLSYAIGPYAVSAAYFHDNSKSIAGLNGTGKADSTNVYDLGAAYTAGPGVVFSLGFGYVDYKGSQVDPNQPWLNNNNGVIVASGVKLTF